MMPQDHIPLSPEQAQAYRDKFSAMPKFATLAIQPGSAEWPTNIEVNSTIPDLLIVKHKMFTDERGETEAPFIFSQIEKVLGRELKMTQTTRSRNMKVGTRRGLHTAPYLKITECTSGKVTVVAVDCREGSPSFMKIATIDLVCSKGEQIGTGLVIPCGCAHAYITLTDDADYQYISTGVWTPEIEVGISFMDPRIMAGLPNPPTILSEKDKANAFVSEIFS